MGDNDWPPQGCWAYTGKVGPVGGENGQTVNLGNPGCMNMGTVIHEVMHSLGEYYKSDVSAILLIYIKFCSCIFNSSQLSLILLMNI